jgi:hypothetical protein
VQVAFLRQELTLKEDQYEEQLKAERQLSAEQLRREKDKCTAEIGAQMSQVRTALLIMYWLSTCGWFNLLQPKRQRSVTVDCQARACVSSAILVIYAYAMVV